MITKLVMQRLFGATGITINGSNPWDPQILDDRWYPRVLLHGSVGLGDSYMDGWWECADIAGLIERIVKSGIHLRIPRLDLLQRRLRFGMIDTQTRSRSRRVAEVHYDEDPRFFEMMLGRTNSYTCGRWNGVTSLDQAQNQKMDLTCRKAGLEPGKTVLDIGSGWGGFLGYAAERYGAHGIGLTISRRQREYAAERYRSLPVEFRLQDYRDFNGLVDAVVSICVIEHVGPSHYCEYFQKACDSLERKDGLFVMQCILACDEHARLDPWTEKHIFPYGRLPTIYQIEEATQGIFYLLDQETFPNDYVKTFNGWRENLLRHRNEIVESYGLRYFRKYDFYLSLYIAGFGSGRISVSQFVFSPTDLRSDYTSVRL